MAVLPFLKMARAFTDSHGKIHVRFPNDFAKNIVEKAGVFDAILAALSISLGREMSPSDVTLSVLIGDEDISELDDLII